MKAIDSSLINKSAKTTSGNREEACPTCGEASWCFENGVVRCLDHGYFEPEPTDVRLYAMQTRFNQQHGLVFPLAGLGPVPAHDDDFASRHRPVPVLHEALPAHQPSRAQGMITPVTHTAHLVIDDRGARAASVTSIDRVDGDIQRAYDTGSRSGC